MAYGTKHTVYRQLISNVGLKRMGLYEKYPNSKFLKKTLKSSFGLPKILEDLFSYLDGLEDTHFDSQLDQDCEARIWEMMVAKMLRLSGFELKSSDVGPDFTIETQEARINVEAVCPGTGDPKNINAVPEIEFGTDKTQKIPEKIIATRLTNAISSKKNAYIKHLESSHVNPKDRFIIAVGMIKLQLGRNLWPPMILRTTLGMGNSYAMFSADPDIETKQGIEHRGSVQKTNDAEVSTELFLQEDYNIVTGILFSEASPFTLGFNLYEGALVVHNPLSLNPLTTGLFKDCEDIWTIKCAGEDMWKPFRMS